MTCPNLYDQPKLVRDTVRGILAEPPGAARARAVADLPQQDREQVLSLLVTDLAIGICKEPDRERRRLALRQAPDTIRDRVEGEARRLWLKRQGL